MPNAMRTTPGNARAALAPPTLRTAGALTLLVGLLVIAVAVGTLAQLHGAFSIGVGVMLVLYGLLVGTLGVLGLRGRGATTGGMAALAVLHVLVVASTARHDAVWLWWLLPVLLVTLACAVHARVVLARRED